MSATPPKKDVEPEGESPDNEEQPMDRAEGTQEQGGFEFEVKEQNRWLPIANGQYLPGSFVCDPLISAVSFFLHPVNECRTWSRFLSLQSSPH